MRIVHVTDCFLPLMGGIETQVNQLATQQSLSGDDVVVLTCASPVQSDGSTFDDRALPFKVARSVWPNPFGAPFDPKAPRRFSELIRRIDPDVVHFHLGELTPGVQGSIRRLRSSGIPMVVTVHSVWNRSMTIPAYRALARAFNLEDSPILWTGVSELVCRRLRDVFGADNVLPLSNGIDSGAWRVQPIQHAGVVAVTAGRFAPRKRMTELIRILIEVISRTGADASQFRAVLAGQGPGLDGARRLVAKHGLTDQISLPGRLSAAELKELYAGADVFLSPAVQESFSIAATEAQAAGLAVLARSQSGLGERLTASEGAVASTDAAFADQLVSWVEDPAPMYAAGEYNRSHPSPADLSVSIPQTTDRYLEARRRANAAC